MPVSVCQPSVTSRQRLGNTHNYPVVFKCFSLIEFKFVGNAMFSDNIRIQFNKHSLESTGIGTV